MRRAAGCCLLGSSLLLAALSAGCSRSAPLADQDLAALLANDSRASGPAASAEEYDFGPILARGQTLHHDFLLKNPTARPVRLLKATALTPCCSAVGPLPDAIPPGGTAKVPVVLKPGFQTGRKRVGFTIETDDPDRPIRVLALLASLTSEIEIAQAGGSSPSLLMGQTGQRLLRVTCRRIGDEGRRAPASVEAAPPITASFTGSVETHTLPDGLIEEMRVVDVTLPASSEVGGKQAEIRLRWADGFDKLYTIAWRVEPRIHVTPSGFVLHAKSERITQTVQLRSDDKPFRITEISGPGLAETTNPLPSASSTSHLVKLVLDPTRVQPGTTDIQFATDHPDQPSVTVSVLIVPLEKGGSE